MTTHIATLEYTLCHHDYPCECLPGSLCGHDIRAGEDHRLVPNPRGTTQWHATDYVHYGWLSGPNILREPTCDACILLHFAQEEGSNE